MDASLTVPYAVIADLSKRAEPLDVQKSQRLLVHSNGLTGAAFGLSFIIGPALGGFLFSVFGLNGVFGCTAAVMGACSIITFAFIGEVGAEDCLALATSLPPGSCFTLEPPLPHHRPDPAFNSKTPIRPVYTSIEAAVEDTVGGCDSVHWVWYSGQGSQNTPAVNIAELVQTIVRGVRAVGAVCAPGAGLDRFRGVHLPLVGGSFDGLEPGISAESHSAERARRERRGSARLRGACVTGGHAANQLNPPNGWGPRVNGSGPRNIPNLHSNLHSHPTPHAPHRAQYICFGMLDTPIEQWIMMAFTSPSSLADPSIRSALAERVSLPEQGKLQG